MFIVVVLSILIVLDLAWAFGACWMQRHSTRRRLWRWLTIGFVLLQVAALSIFVTLRFGGGGNGSFGLKAVAANIFLWHVILLPLLVCLLWGGLGLWGIGKLFGAIGRVVSGQRKAAAMPATGIPRREFLAASLACLPPVLTTGAATVGVVQLQHFRLRRVELPLANLPAALDGFRIAHVSDLHAGPFTSGPVLDDIVKATNDLRADLAVFTGDLVNTSLADLPPGLALLKRIEARHSLYVIEGNHDLIENGTEFERRIRQSGLNFLLNEERTLTVNGTPVQLLGLRWGGLRRVASRQEQHGDGAIRDSMAELLTLRKPDAFPILLAHHPHAFDCAAAAGIPLTLSGHTHGGQLMLNEALGFGPVLFRYWSGIYERGASRLFVSNGVGNWFPLRTAAPAEIAEITLRRAG